MTNRAFCFRESGGDSERCDRCGASGAVRYPILVHFFMRLCDACKARLDAKIKR